MDFVPLVTPPDNIDLHQDSLWVVFHQGELLLCEQRSDTPLPCLADLASIGIAGSSRRHFLGLWYGRAVCAIDLPEPPSLPSHFSWQAMRHFAVQTDEQHFSLAARAWQVIRWDQDHRFCGRCGNPTHAHERDRAKVCTVCGYTQYPRLSPCIITLVTRGPEVLLARAPRWPTGLFSTLAGFVEPGETLEQAVEREIWEEVSVRVHRLRYFGSQPWPFPHSLMVGFIADYAGGDIVPDDDEISEAAWFHIDQLPRIPPAGSISRALIEYYRSGYLKNER